MRTHTLRPALPTTQLLSYFRSGGGRGRESRRGEERSTLRSLARKEEKGRKKRRGEGTGRERGTY